MVRRMPVVLVLLLAVAIPTAGADPAPDRIERLCSIYQTRDNWCLRAFALLGLAGEADDRVVTALEAGLADAHELVRGIAACALRDLPEATLKGGATAEYIDRLLGQYLVSKQHPLEPVFAYAHLKTLAGEDYGRNLTRWKKWWTDLRPTYAPPPLGRIPPPATTEERGRTEALLDRILDLQNDGLDLVLAIDATGSMGPYLEAAKQRLADLTRILQLLIPADKLRMGLVTYNDEAQIVCELTTRLEDLRKRLGRVSASGGADWEEGVDKAFETAVRHRKMDWRREAAKVVILCGDAAAHSADLESMYALVKQMHEAPDKLSKIVLSGKKGPVKPFIVSCVHTLLEPDLKGRKPPPDPAADRARVLTETCFRKIAANGGGTYVVASQAAEVIVQLLVLSFGTEWEDQIRPFLKYVLELDAP